MKHTMALRTICLYFSATLLGACTSVPSQNEVAKADYGIDMSTRDCVTAAEQTIASGLKDPGSAQFTHAPCEKGYWQSVPIMGMSVAFGYFQKGSVNAKNAYGGYVGFRPYSALIRNGRVIRYCISDSNGICIPTGQ